MSSLCRLSSGSQFCLGGSPRSSVPDRDLLRMQSSPLSLSTLSGQTPDSIRRRELDSGGHSDAMSRNTSFMISLMDICNKMILPLAALQQDCATCAASTKTVAGADFVANSSRFASPLPPSFGGDIKEAGPPLTDSCWAQLGRVGHTAGQGCPCLCRCLHEEATAKKKAGVGPQLPQSVMALQQTNQHQPMEQRSECAEDTNNANSDAAKAFKTQNRGVSKNSKLSVASQPQPPAANRPSKATIGSNVEMSFCDLNDAALANAELRPLLKRHAVPFWNTAEFQDFRASSPETQMQEPMLDIARHRHMIILDSHYRLKATIAGFRAPVYRPY